MVDARLTPLAAMGLDRNALMRDGLRLHGGVVYPGLRPVSAEKSRDNPTVLPLGYGRDGSTDLYKPDLSLDNRKASNGYMGLYKNPPSGLHKPVLLPGSEGLGLDRRVGIEKSSELGLGGASTAASFIHLPWLSPYPEAGIYPFMDSSKYAALNMYKASLLSQPSSYFPQNLAYQSLCAAQGGNINPSVATSTAERLYFMPPYPPSPLSSSLVAPPVRIPAVSVAPSSLVHCQEKGLAVGPRIHHESSPYGQQLLQVPPPPKHHQTPTDRERHREKDKDIKERDRERERDMERNRERERPPSRSGKPCRPPSSIPSSTTSGCNTSSISGLPIDSSPRASSHLPQPPPPQIDTSDLQRLGPRTGQVTSSSSSTQSMHRTFYISSVGPENPSPAQPSSHKPRSRDGVLELRVGGCEKRPSHSPSKPSTEWSIHPAPSTKDPPEKPLDLSGRMLEYDLTPNGYPAKLEALAMARGGPGGRYSLPPCREHQKETHLNPTVNSTSSKSSERPEMISTLHSSWVVPTKTPRSSHAHHPALPQSPRPTPDHMQPLPQSSSSSSVIKHKAVDKVLPLPHCSPNSRLGESINPSLATSMPLSPKTNSDWLKHSPGQSESSSVFTNHREIQEKISKAVKRPEPPTQEVLSFKRQCMENGHTPSHLYLPQGEAYRPHSLAYANRYLHYRVPDGMSLHPLPHTMPGKGPVYPHPVLLGGSSLYPAHLAAPKHSLPYLQSLPSAASQVAGEYLTYNSQEMVHPLMHPHPNSNPRERTGDGSLSQPEREASDQGGSQTKQLSYTKRIVCIDLVHSDTDGECFLTSNKHIPPLPQPVQHSRSSKKECCNDNQNGREADCETKHQHNQHDNHHLTQSISQKPNATDRHQETTLCGRSKATQDTSGASTPPKGSPVRLSRPVENLEDLGPRPDPAGTVEQDQSTLRCARTSGERTTREGKEERDRRELPHASMRIPALEIEGQVERDRESERESERDSMADLDESHGEGEGEEGGHESCKALRRSSLAKRIANSSGYVGDRIKCVTTELYADSSKLSREQRALQMEVISREASNITQPAAIWERAMMRFSELELKEKEGGECVSASAAGHDLADSQRRNRELEICQHTARHTGREGGQTAHDSNRVPVLQTCGAQTKNHQNLFPGQGASDWAQGGCQSGARDRSQKVFRERESGQPVEHQLEENPGLELLPSRKRAHSSQRERGEVERRERGSHTEITLKASSDDNLNVNVSKLSVPNKEEEEDEEVQKLKVCIELKGLRLSKPSSTSPDRPEVKEDRAWPHQLRPSESEVKAVTQRAEINRSWANGRIVNIENNQAASLNLWHPKERPPLQGPLSVDRDRGPRGELRRGIPGGPGVPLCAPSSVALQLPATDTHPLKHRRHSEGDKPKGKRPCKTKHTGPRVEKEGDRRRVACSKSTNHHRSPSDSKPVPKAKMQPSRSGPVSAEGPGELPLVTPAVRPIPPEARRLIVNKNAGETLLQRAARLGYEEVVLYCLENRVCEVNHRDYAGYCALHEACARGWINIVTHLLEHGADINCSAQDGTRPLHDAVENNHLDVVRVLLSYGADPTLATYSGRGLLKMTHSHSMERFLTEYFADLQGRTDGDPGVFWEFYGSAVCESTDDGGVFDILAEPPEPEKEDSREVFQFEFSDRPLLPCYNIQVSLSQGPRNWLLLSDVLQRLRISARSFRSTFPHLEVVTVAEAEFYRQASLSQLFSCPDELDAFQPDSKELLDLVEGSSELATMLGSSLECLDDHWDEPREAVENTVTMVNSKAAGNSKAIANAKAMVMVNANTNTNMKSMAKTNVMAKMDPNANAKTMARAMANADAKAKAKAMAVVMAKADANAKAKQGL